MKRFHLIFAIFTLTVLLNFQIAQVEATVTTPYMLPSGRAYTSAVWDGSHAYVFGGSDGTNYLDDIVQFNPSTGTVTTLTSKLPSGRIATSAVWDGSHAYIFGGSEDGTLLDDIVQFDPSTGTVTTPYTLPTPRFYTAAVWDGSNAYIFGGIDNVGYLDEIIRFNPSTGTVTTLTSKLPSGRNGMSAVWDGSHAYIFGGQYLSYLDDIVRFTPPWPVGGVVTPINKLVIFAPYIALAGLIAAVSTVYIIKKRKD